MWDIKGCFLVSHFFFRKEGNRMSKLSDAAKEARRAYQREWYARNREKVADYNAKRWERKAAAAAERKVI